MFAGCHALLREDVRAEGGSAGAVGRRHGLAQVGVRAEHDLDRLGEVSLVGRAARAARARPLEVVQRREFVRVDAVLPPYVPTHVIPWSRAAGDGAIFAGRLSPEKGAAEAIDIARAAGVPIDVYGDAYDAGYSRDQIGPRRAWPGVTVHEAVPRASLWAAMAHAAVVLFPARWAEPFGMAAAEAQACGTPVVAFRCGALGEVIASARPRSARSVRFPLIRWRC